MFKLILNIAMLVQLALAGCGDIKGHVYGGPGGANPPAPSESIFPHKAGWGEPANHGKFVIDRKGIGLCNEACHGKDFNGGSARGCRTCHKDYPHPPAEVWQGLMGHGILVRQSGDTKTCARCHGEDLKGGYDPADKKSCSRCHTSYPVRHGEGDWGSSGHGRFVIQVGGSNECSSTCHRTDVPGELKIIGCADCHPSYPTSHQEDGWGSAGKHSEFLSLHGGVALADCSTCHGKRLSGGTGGIACTNSTCHHISGKRNAVWRDADEHGAAATLNISKCTKCHGEDLKGNAVVIGCDTCHHKNWADTNEGPWADISQHGVYGREPSSSCKVCHGADLKGGAAGVNCYTCHGEIYPHSDAWADKIGHGLAARGDLAKCKACHGGVASADCKSCHHENDEDWQRGSHRVAAREDTIGCKVCHGVDLKGGESGRSCFDCHDTGDHYPHPADWGEQFNHGIVYKEDPPACTTACHGTDLGGGLGGYACNTCHGTYPHPEGGEWLDSHGASVLNDVDDFDVTAFQGSRESSCARCHGGLYSHKKYEFPDAAPPYQEPSADILTVFNPATDNPVNSRCYGCHFAYPHIEGKITANEAPRPWREAHSKSVMTTWGSAREMCSVGDACHSVDRRSTNPVRLQNGTMKRLRSAYCTAFCHK